MRAVILHGIMAVPAQQQPFGVVPNHFQQHPGNGRGGNVMGNGRGGSGGRLIVGGAVVSQWDNNRGGSAQQRLVRARKDKDSKKGQSAKSQAKRQNQKVTDFFKCLLFFHRSALI